VIVAVCFEGDGVWRVAIANAVIAVDTNDGYCRDLQDRRRSGCGAAATRGRLRNRGRWRQQRPDQKGRRQRRSHQKRGPIGPFQSHKEERAQPGVRASERGGNRRGPRGFTLRVPAQPLGICRSPLGQSGSTRYRPAYPGARPVRGVRFALVPNCLPCGNSATAAVDSSLQGSRRGLVGDWRVMRLARGLCACRQGARGRRARRSPRKCSRSRPRSR
jgi:hypothetical protein